MAKKLFIGLLALLFLTTGLYFLISKSRHPTSLSQYCAFCNSAVTSNQKFYEDDLILALYTHKPIFPGHCLVIPKRHVERFEMLTDAEITQIGAVIKKVHAAAMHVYGTSAYLLLQKNGIEVGQSVPHVHFHYIPRKLSDSSSIKFVFNMYLSNIKKPITEIEMHEQVEKMQAAMEYDCYSYPQVSRP